MHFTKTFAPCLLACIGILSLAACGGGGGVTDEADSRVRVLVQASFVHEATDTNSSANLTYLNHPGANGNPSAVLIVTQNWNPYESFGTWNDHPVGAHYDEGRGQWAVMNVDRVTMPPGAAFNVTVSSAPIGGNTAFTRHRATAANIDGHTTYLDHLSLNGNPDAVLFITPYHHPGGGGTALNPHVLSALYNSTTERWGIFNQDDAPMQVDAAFGVAITLVGGGVPIEDSVVHYASAANIDFNFTYCDITRSRDAILHASHVFNPGGSWIGVRNNRVCGVWFDETVDRWAVFNQDSNDMATLVAYHVGLATR